MRCLFLFVIGMCYNINMTKTTREKTSKTMAYALRHKPEEFALSMNAAGWVEIRELAKALSTTVTEITEIAEADAKQRYTIKGSKIRAAQGHSFPVELGLESLTPPETLYHGTVSQFLTPIFEKGLIPGKREFVHLSASIETATAVGARRGKPIILKVAALEAFESGVIFHQAENGVWLTKALPSKFISIA